MSVDANLILVAPEFEAVDASIRAAMIVLAEQSVGDVFGINKDLATAYLTAHMLTLRNRSGNGGAVKSLKEGELSLTYSESGKDKDGAYNATSYGQEFVRLRRQSVFAARTRVV